MENNYIAISGGFDPLHIGHVRYILDAKLLGNVLVFLNTDEWLIRKKGYAFMPFYERKEIIEALGVQVVPAQDDDETVCQSIEIYAMEIMAFAKGGDRTYKNTPEIALCEKLEIPIILGLGGGKIQSSSELIKNVRIH